MSRNSTGRVSKSLEKALEAELKEVTRRWEEGDTMPEGKKAGDFRYGAVERCRIIDRLLKMESLKLKVTDDSFGSEFGKGGD